jgi:16S rRNA (adenine1518-N6/adenine1519-N6)-dimethyltransferase
MCCGLFLFMPKKRFGQHFLTDPGILDRIVTFSRVQPADLVVEIGPGRGALTTRLAASAKSITVIEIDHDLIAGLRQSMPANVRVIEQDALDVDYRAVSTQGYLLVANLPYNIATPLIERFTAARSCIGSVTIMVQKEVADRILAGPGRKDYGPLSVGVQHYARVEPGFVLPPGAFKPPPKVQSRMIRLEWRPDVADNPAFIRFVRHAFASRRKKLVNNLAAIVPGSSREHRAQMLERAGAHENARPEELSPEQFLRLFSEIEDGRS